MIPYPDSVNRPGFPTFLKLHRTPCTAAQLNICRQFFSASQLAACKLYFPKAHRPLFHMQEKKYPDSVRSPQFVFFLSPAPGFWCCLFAGLLSTYHQVHPKDSIDHEFHPQTDSVPDTTLLFSKIKREKITLMGFRGQSEEDNGFFLGIGGKHTRTSPRQEARPSPLLACWKSCLRFHL